jgi:hypothetical protein
MSSFQPKALLCRREEKSTLTVFGDRSHVIIDQLRRVVPRVVHEVEPIEPRQTLLGADPYKTVACLKNSVDAVLGQAIVRRPDPMAALRGRHSTEQQHQKETNLTRSTDRHGYQVSLQLSLITSGISLLR